ncbi:MAG: tetratricopeptide repeat protein [Cyanobacteria bacterium]|nr:tetratricopeptide repeat protein [Cyanobacteriota bacterium]
MNEVIRAHLIKGCPTVIVLFMVLCSTVSEVMAAQAGWKAVAKEASGAFMHHDYSRSEQLLRQAITMAESRHVGEAHLINLYINLAEVLRHQRKLDQAMQVCNLCQSRIEKLKLEKEPVQFRLDGLVLKVQEGLGCFEPRTIGRRWQLLKRRIEMAWRLFGSDSPSYIVCVTESCTFAFSCGELDSGFVQLKQLEVAYKTRRSKLKLWTTKVRIACELLRTAVVYKERYGAAGRLLEDCAKIDLELPPPLRLECYSGLAQVYANTGRVEDARRMTDKALAIIPESLSEGDRWVAGGAYIRLGRAWTWRPVQCQNFYRKAMQIFSVFPPGSQGFIQWYLAKTLLVESLVRSNNLQAALKETDEELPRRGGLDMSQYYLDIAEQLIKRDGKAGARKYIDRVIRLDSKTDFSDPEKAWVEKNKKRIRELESTLR